MILGQLKLLGERQATCRGVDINEKYCKIARLHKIHTMQEKLDLLLLFMARVSEMPTKHEQCDDDVEELRLLR